MTTSLSASTTARRNSTDARHRVERHSNRNARLVCTRKGKLVGSDGALFLGFCIGFVAACFAVLLGLAIVEVAGGRDKPPEDGK